MMNRCRRSEEIFTKKNDCELFLELLKESSNSVVEGVKQRLSKDLKFRDRVIKLSEKLNKGHSAT